jgi:hypothetical protein
VNWRASLTAAVIVLAGGVAVGAILGASSTRTRTVTRVVRSAGSRGTPTPSATGGAPTTPAAPTASRVPLTSVQRQLNNIDPNEVSTPGLADLNGTKLQNALVIDHLFTDCTGRAATSGIAWIMFPVNGLARFTGTLGLNTTGGKTDSAFSMTVEARANSADGRVLREPHAYQGSGTVEAVDVRLKCASNLLFVFRGLHRDVCSGDPGFANPRESELVFGDAVLTR